MYNCKMVSMCIAVIYMVIGGAAAQVELPAGVEETSLAKSPFSTGLLTARDGALSADIWQGADVSDLLFLLSQTPSRPATPAIGEGLRRALLSSAAEPDGAVPALGGAKLMSLARLGFLEEVRTIASLSSARQSDLLVGQALAIADLSEGKLDDACQRNARLSGGRDESFWVKLRIICYVAAQETDAADLTLGLLRETGGLDLREQALFEALVTGLDLKEPPLAISALELAMLRLLEVPVTPQTLIKADGGVVVGIARDASNDAQMRLSAALNAVSLGVMSRDELAAFMASFKFEPSEISAAQTAAQAGKTTTLDDVKIFHAVRQMDAPEFLRDKAALISRALAAADTIVRAHALAVLYAPDIAELEGALIAPQDASQFAISSMAVGQPRAAARWLNMMIGGGLASLEEKLAMRAIYLINYLWLLDPEAAVPVAATANVEITDPRSPGGKVIDANDVVTARIVTSILDAATDRIEGQAILTAAAAARDDGLQNPLMRAIVDRALKIAQAPDIAGRVRFETAWASAFTYNDPVEKPVGGEPFGPRLKPAAGTGE